MKPGRERSKAWMYSVINPLLNGLSSEASFLAKGKLDFSPTQQRPRISPSHLAFVDYQSRPNWEDFIAFQPEDSGESVRS